MEFSSTNIFMRFFTQYKKGKKGCWAIGIIYKYEYRKKAIRRDNIRSACVSVLKMKVVTKMIRTLVILTTGATS